MSNEKNCEKNPEKLDIMLKFLKLTKEGKYSPIETDQAHFKMIDEETVEESEDTTYFYGIR